MGKKDNDEGWFSKLTDEDNLWFWYIMLWVHVAVICAVFILIVPGGPGEKFVRQFLEWVLSS